MEIPKLYNYYEILEAYLENATNIVQEQELQGISTLEFSLPLNDSKAANVVVDKEIVWGGRRYYITQIEDEREGTQAWKRVHCDEIWLVELGKRLYTQDINWEGVSVYYGLNTLLSGTNWIIGQIEGDMNKIHWMKDSKNNILYLMREWANICGYEIEFDSMNRRVFFRTRIGRDNGTVFRYKKNLRNVKRTVQPPEATVLYMYGKAGLALNQVNYSLQQYIENYSYYLDQGFTLEQARALFKREVVIVDESITSLNDLYDKAWATLYQLSAPKYIYECTIADISEQTGQDAFDIGDIITVYDEVANVNIKERIVRIKRVATRPQDTEVELANPVPVLENVLSGTTNTVSGTAGFGTFHFENANAIEVSGPTNIIALSVDNLSSAQAIIGALIVGQASTAATVEISLTVGNTNTIPTIRQVVSAGWNTIAIPKFVVMNSGNVTVKFSMNINNGTFTIPAKNAQVYIFVQGAGGYSAYSDHTNSGYTAYSDWHNTGYKAYSNFTNTGYTKYSDHTNSGYTKYSDHTNTVYNGAHTNTGYTKYSDHTNSGYSAYSNFSNSGYSAYSDHTNTGYSVAYGDHTNSGYGVYNNWGNGSYAAYNEG